MIAKLLLVGLLISVSTFTAQSTPRFECIQAKTNTELVGFFSVGGQILEAWGNFNGTITELYIVDNAGNRIGQAHSWTGTYVGNDIDISVQLTSGGSSYPYQGTCWI